MLVALVAIVGTIGFASEAHAGHHAGDHNDLPLTVHTDSAIYGHNDTITVTGQVANVIPGNVPITVTVMSPMSSLVTIDQFNVASDGSFETTMSTSGNLWKYDGTYIIEVNYGSLDNNVKVELDGGVAVVEKKHMDHGDDKHEMHHDDVECGSSEVNIGGNCTSYDISNGHVTSATVNTDDNSVIINIHAEDDGVLTISPSTSTQKGIFMVLVDGEESDDAEINGNTVIVPFGAETEQIEIIGTFVVPEFGTIAAMILAVAIISIVAISAKSRLSIVPRY
jgi:predicted secreted protein with PEFG-CTERM motif